jgi:energy-coupling factor transporter transmembrane protein EcfT
MVGWEDLISKMIVQTSGSADIAGIILLIIFNIFLAVLRLPFVITLICNGVLILTLLLFFTGFTYLIYLAFPVVIGTALFIWWVFRKGTPISERY